MKQRTTWLVLAILAVAIGMQGMSYTPEATSQATPTAEPLAERSLGWQSLDGPNERVAFALAVAPNSRLLYAGTWGHSVYFSWDGGQSWEPATIEGAPYVRSLAVWPSSEQVIFAGTYRDGLYQSTDSGRSWKQMGGFSDFTATDEDHPHRSSFHIESLLFFSDEGAEKILVGTHNGIWVSGVLSDTWTHLDAGFDKTDEAYNVRALARDPAGRLYAGTVDGLYVSQDGGQKWRHIAPPEDYPDEARRILSLTVVTDTANYNGTLLIGTQGAGTYALEKIESGAWLTRTTGFPDDPDAWRIQALLSTPDGTVYAGTVDHGVLESKDGGQTWTQRWDGLPESSKSVTSLAWDTASDTLYAGTYGDGVYQLSSGGEVALVWEAANEGLPVDFAVQKIAFAGPESKQLFAGLKVGGLYTNTDRQEPEPTWQRLPKALPIGQARDVTGLIVSGPERDTIVVAAGAGIFRSTDVGETWDHLDDEQGLPEGDVPATALVQGKQNPEILYTALEGGEGLYRSDDGGASWNSAAGSLDESLRTNICCLAVGADNDTLYLGLGSTPVYTTQVYLTRDAGETWQPLFPISTQALQGLSWSRRTPWDVFLYGGPEQMLYARTREGIYVSYDDGQSWQLRLRGFFSTLLVDPFHPWVVYVGSPITTLSLEVIDKVELKSDLWISYDGGETWTWAGVGPSLPTEPSPGSITTLAFDPNDAGRLYVGTEGTGIFWAELLPHTRAFTPRAVALIIIVIVLLAVLAFILWTGLSLGRHHGLPPHTWLKLALLRVFRSMQVGLVSDRHTPLSYLESLVFALAPDRSFQSEDVWRTLTEKDIPIDLIQVEMVLQKLTADYRLLRSSERNYQQLSPLLGRMARARFWEDAEERERLIKEIRGQSRLRAGIRRFFRLAGFDTFSFETGFRVTSNQPEYALLGADRGIYVHLHTAAVEAVPIHEVRDSAYRAYESQLASRIAFLVVTCCPELEALQAITHLRREEDLRPVLLPYSHIRHATEAMAARQVLDGSLQRSLGDRDLFELEGPARNPLDFFGREANLQRLVAACENGQAMGLTGMAKVGKTSLIWQVMDRLPNALVAWLDLNGPPTWELYVAIRQHWLAEARARFPTWEQPQREPPSEPFTADEIAADLEALHGSLLDQDPAIDLAAAIDGLPDPQGGAQILETLAQAIAVTAGVSLLCVFARPGPSEMFDPLSLQPLGPEDSAELIHSLAAQMALEFSQGATDQLHRESGGHPLILRQLASWSIAQKGGTDRQIHAEDIEEAVSRYVAQPDSTLSLLWASLTKEEQRVLRAAIDTGSSPVSDTLTLLENLGWLRWVDGRWELCSQAVPRWLETHPPA